MLVFLGVHNQGMFVDEICNGLRKRSRMYKLHVTYKRTHERKIHRNCYLGVGLPQEDPTKMEGQCSSWSGNMKKMSTFLSEINNNINTIKPGQTYKTKKVS